MCCSKIVEAKFREFRQRARGKCELDAYTKSSDVRNCAIVERLRFYQQLPSMHNFGSLEPSFVHLVPPDARENAKWQEPRDFTDRDVANLMDIEAALID